VYSFGSFPKIYGLYSTNPIDNTRFKLKSNHKSETRLTACLPALIHLGGTCVSSCLA
jgi:hypothetical protein